MVFHNIISVFAFGLCFCKYSFKKIVNFEWWVGLITAAKLKGVAYDLEECLAQDPIIYTDKPKGSFYGGMTLYVTTSNAPTTEISTIWSNDQFSLCKSQFQFIFPSKIN